MKRFKLWYLTAGKWVEAEIIKAKSRAEVKLMVKLNPNGGNWKLRLI